MPLVRPAHLGRNGAMARVVVRALAAAQRAGAWRRRPAKRARRSDLTPPDGCLVAGNQLGVYAVPLSGLRRPATQRILAGRVWEARTLDLLRRLAAEGDVIHAGTYFGDFLPGLAMAPGAGRVVAFEPNPESHRCARLTVELNGLRNVVLHEAAVGDQDRELHLVTTDDRGRPLGGAARLADDVSGTTVRSVRIDDVVDAARRVSGIHLDVEGQELAAVRGALETIGRDRPVIVLEDGSSARAAADELATLGYRLAARLERNIVLRS